MSTKAELEALAAEMRETAKATIRESEAQRDNDRVLYFYGQAHGLRYAEDRLDQIAAQMPEDTGARPAPAEDDLLRRLSFMEGRTLLTNDELWTDLPALLREARERIARMTQELEELQ